MANLTPQNTTVMGTVALTAVTPTVTVGDTVPVGSFVTVRNASGGSINVTINKPGNDSYGDARGTHVQAVAAGAARRFGPFPADLGDPANSNLVTLICSAVASVTLEVTY
jgi:hypothetical protein